MKEFVYKRAAKSATKHVTCSATITAPTISSDYNTTSDNITTDAASIALVVASASLVKDSSYAPGAPTTSNEEALAESTSAINPSPPESSIDVDATSFDLDLTRSPIQGSVSLFTLVLHVSCCE